MKDLIELMHNSKTGNIPIENLVIEYSTQDKDEIFATQKVDYDENWLLSTVGKYQEYWLGNRFAQGVEIEEAWKCSMCSFADNCDWRKAKAAETRTKISL